MEKFPMDEMVAAIDLSRRLRETQFLANLNTLNSLKALKQLIPPPPSSFIIISRMLKITMVKSKMFILSPK